MHLRHLLARLAHHHDHHRGRAADEAGSTRGGWHTHARRHFFEWAADGRPDHGRRQRRHAGEDGAEQHERGHRHAWFAHGGRGGLAGFRGFGRGGEDFAGGDGMQGGGRRGGGGGRMFGHGDLKLLLLALIEQAPRHGYELIRIIGEMFHGQYTPSPGAIYPTLTLLEELGQVELSLEAGGRKLYAITDAGRAFLDENRAAVEAASARTEQSARMAARLALPAAVREAMSVLKHAMLMRGTGWTATEAKRVAAILARAAREIGGGGEHD